mgnify:CR=1 FL=1
MEIIAPERLPRIAYFSMEIGLEAHIPTYSGGLGVLAGDTLRSAAELGLPMAGVTLVYRQGYFRQHLDAQGNQTESPAAWNPGRHPGTRGTAGDHHHRGPAGEGTGLAL